MRYRSGHSLDQIEGRRDSVLECASSDFTPRQVFLVVPLHPIRCRRIPLNCLRINNQINGQSESQKVANAVGGFYGDRYGSMEGFKRALATDPAGIAADAATALTGAGALTSKVPGLVGVGEGMFKAGQAVDPLLQSYKAAKVAIPAVGRGVANIIGGIGTHTGGESLK